MGSIWETILARVGIYFGSFGDSKNDQNAVRKLTLEKVGFEDARVRKILSSKGGEVNLLPCRRFGSKEEKKRRKKDRKKGRFEDLNKGLHALTRRVGGCSIYLCI